MVRQLGAKEMSLGDGRMLDGRPISLLAIRP